MEFANPFSATGEWYRGNLHTHSSGSDGVQSSEEVVKRYQEAGYDFLAMTDHKRVTPVSRVPQDFLVLAGVELDGGVTDVGGSVHIVGFGLAEARDVPREVSVQEMIQWVRTCGGEAIIAHPHWSGLIVQDFQQWHGYVGIEVFNSSCHFSIAKGFARSHWDDLLARGVRGWGFATDDSHQHWNDHRPEDTCCAWVMVKASTLTREALLDAIREGMFYSSWGPAIENITLTETEVRVRTSPVRRINFVAQCAGGESFTAIAEPTLNKAAYHLRGDEQYLRVECVDSEGRWAWSNPVFPPARG